MKLSKVQKAEKATHVEAITTAYSHVEVAIDDFNAAMALAWKDVEGALAARAEVIEEANTWRESIVEQMQDFSADKSEKWTESDNGQAHADWETAWDDEFSAALDIAEPETIELPDDEVASALEELPDAPGEA